MSIWLVLVLSVHVLAALSIIGLVLLQHGKGADVGAAFGGGASGSLFGASGSANFLSRATATLAVVFFLTSIGLAYLATHRPQTSSSVVDTVQESTAVPAAPVTAPAGGGDKAGTAGAAPATQGEGTVSKSNEVPK